MNKAEVTQILTLLGSNYPSLGKQLESREKGKLILEMWFECLNDLDYNLCMMAVKKSVISSQYPPTIHEIRKSVTEIVTPVDENKTAIELWNEAYKMITRGSYMTEDDFEKHSEVVKRFFGSVGQVKELARSELSIVNTVTKGQFLKQIEVLQTRKKEQDLLPASMRETINQIANNVQAKQIEGE